jgi:acyl-CoA thioesterase FadM
MPFVRAELDFRAPLRPDDDLETTVLLERVGTSSVTTRTLGRLAGGTLSFEGRFVQVFASTSLGKLPVPETLRAAMDRELAIAHAILGAAPGAALGAAPTPRPNAA